MRRSFPTKEEVYVIDSGDFKGRYIFPNYSAGAKMYQNVDAVIVGGMNGNRSPIVKAFLEGDRYSDFKLVNIRKVQGYDIEYIDIPPEVMVKVDKYNSKMSKLREEHLKDEEKDMDLFNEVSKLNGELVSYFER